MIHRIFGITAIEKNPGNPLILKIPVQTVSYLCPAIFCSR